jgi:hypothetical protein
VDQKMKSQRGFILPSPVTLYAAIGALAIIALLGVALKIQTTRLSTLQATHDAFVLQTKLLGDIQEQETKATDLANTKLKEKLDAENATARAALADASRRLRNANSGAGLVPPAPNSSSRADIACFSRAELDDALRNFTGSVGELVIEGESSTIDLDTAKAWAKGLK